MIKIVASKKIELIKDFHSLEQFLDEYPEFKIEYINDKKVMGICDFCKGPVLEDAKYLFNGTFEEIYHVSCIEKELKDNSVLLE